MANSLALGALRPARRIGDGFFAERQSVIIRQNHNVWSGRWGAAGPLKSMAGNLETRPSPPGIRCGEIPNYTGDPTRLRAKEELRLASKAAPPDVIDFVYRSGRRYIRFLVGDITHPPVEGEARLPGIPDKELTLSVVGVAVGFPERQKQ